MQNKQSNKQENKMSDYSKKTILSGYPERKIERNGKSVDCQILYSDSEPWVCYDINSGDKFLARQRLGTMMEVDLLQYMWDTRADLASQKQPETIDKDACVLGGALDALDEIVDQWDIMDDGKYYREKVKTIRTALERKQEPVDVEPLGYFHRLHNTEGEVNTGVSDKKTNPWGIEENDCAGRWCTYEPLYDINAQGYLTQSAEKDAVIRDLAAALVGAEKIIGSMRTGNVGDEYCAIRETLKTHAAAIEAAEKGGE